MSRPLRALCIPTGSQIGTADPSDRSGLNGIHTPVHRSRLLCGRLVAELTAAGPAPKRAHMSADTDSPAPTSTPSASPARRAAVALGLTVAATVLAMMAMGDAAYPWVKAVHVIAIISWMAGMLYLPRLFIYHCEAEKGSRQSETFKVMERRLLQLIINPAMIVSWVLGLWLAWQAGFFTDGWLHAKLAAALALSGVHGYFSAAVRIFARDENRKPARHWRIMNEVPTVLMILIVVLVVVKPF